MEIPIPRNIVLINPENPCPPEIAERIRPIGVRYFDFKGVVQRGTIEIHEELATEVALFFDFIYETQFPLTGVVRSSDEAYQWDDDKLMAANMTSGFNYRLKPTGSEVSLHGQGRAFDLNPALNPYIRQREDGTQEVLPPGALHAPGDPGVLHEGHPLVEYMTRRGWVWGGHWENPKDYQHFEKPSADK